MAPKQNSAFRKLDQLDPRRRLYVQRLREGKTKTAATRDAGFSEAMARSARRSIENANVKAAFREFMRIAVSPEKLVRRIAEGLDATETNFFCARRQGDGRASSDRMSGAPTVRRAGR